MAYLFSLLQDFCAASGQFGRLVPAGNYTFFISHLHGERPGESWRADEIETLTQRVNNDPRSCEEVGDEDGLTKHGARDVARREKSSSSFKNCQTPETHTMMDADECVAISDGNVIRFQVFGHKLKLTFGPVNGAKLQVRRYPKSSGDNETLCTEQALS